MDTKDISVRGRRWDSVQVVAFETCEGMSLEELVLSSIKYAYAHYDYSESQYKSLLRYARCKLNGMERPREEWHHIYPKKGSVIEIFHGVRGGGGGGFMSVVQTIVGAVLTVVGYAMGWTGIGAAIGTVGVGLLISGILSTASSLLFPVASPNMGLGSLGTSAEPEKYSPTYSISGAKNKANVNGYVPLVLGKHRHYPPLGGRSWTSWEGNYQYFHMLVVWGYPDMEVSQFKIGETPLGNFKDVTHVFHQSSYGNDLKYFSNSYKEESVEAVLVAKQGWNTRTVGEAQSISLDFAFLKGLVSINKENGNYNNRTVQIRIQYRRVGSATWLNFSGGSGGTFSFTANSGDRVVRNVRMDGLTKAEYEVRCMRVTPDSTSNYVRDECSWYVMRAIVNISVFATPVPLCVSELRIRAGDQLSGYVEEFNAICHSKVPNWNGATWTTGKTSNPASLMRYVLTSRNCLAKPYSSNKLDNAKLVEFWNYCNKNKYEFNFICDSEESLWERLIHITAPGRAAPTTDVDGKWGVVIDRSDKTPVQMFTPRNSWGLSIQREYAKLPDALRISFIDETDGYTTKEGFIFNDGYSNNKTDSSTKRPEDVVEWDFPGITRWERVYTQGRFYLARMLHRQMTITINTDWEWIVCHRGDLVGVASDVLMNVFGVARINGLLYEIDGEERLIVSEEDKPIGLIPIGVRLDNSILFSTPDRYGIAIRYNTGQLNTYEIITEYNEERNVVRFANTITEAQIPPIGAIVSVSLLGEEYEEYLVAQITPQNNTVAQITLIPYKMKEIEAAASGPIPDYSENVVLDVVRGAELPAPTIVQVISDESVLGGYTGASIPRIAVWWGLPRMSQNVALLGFQLRATDVETGKILYASVEQNEGFIAIQGVEEKHIYDLRLRMLNPATGVTSSWSPVVRHVCIGRTTPPPPPTQVFLDGTVLKIAQQNRPQDVVGHVIYMVFDESDPIEYSLKLTDTYTSTGTFDIGPWAGYARRVYVRTIDEIGLLSDPVSIAVNLIDREVKNVLFTIREYERQWPGVAVNGSVENNFLVAFDNAGLWSTTDSVDIWQSLDRNPIWASGAAMQMTYTYGIEVPAAYSGSNLRVEPQEFSGRLLSIEYRVAEERDLWAGDQALLWVGEDEDRLWAEPVFSEWGVLPTNYTVSGGEILEIRVTYAGGEEQAILSDIWTILDVPDIEWAVEDIEIAADGTAVPIPSNYFRAITNVVATLQYSQGDTGVTVVYIPGSTVVGQNGYLEAGPILRVLDAARAPTTGNVDVRLKGY